MKQNLSSNDPSVIERDELLSRIQELEERCRRSEDALRTLEEQNRILGDSAPFGIFVVDTEGSVFGANQKMIDMLAWPEGRDITQLNIFNHEPLVVSGVADLFRRCMEQRIRVISDHSCLTDDDGCAHMRYNISPVIDMTGSCTGIIAFVEDVTELKLAEEAIIASEKKYRLLFESAPVAMVERDAGELKLHLDRLRADGISDLHSYFDDHPQELIRCLELIKTVDSNTAFLGLMEAQTWDEIERGFKMTNSTEDFTRMAQEIIMMVAEGNISHEREETFMTLKGNKKSVLSKSLPLFGHEDTLSGIIIAMVDITKRKQAEEALRTSEQLFREQAMQDILTGLYNRRYLYQSLNNQIQEAKKNGSVISLIFMDLDRFKEIVDTHGHLNGSRTIREVAQTIRETIEKPAYAVAYAGDEFVVVLPGFDPSQAIGQAEKIETRIKNCVFLRNQGLEVRIQASFGIASFPYHADDMTNLLAAADQALFGAKGSRKDRIKSFG